MFLSQQCVPQGIHQRWQNFLCRFPNDVEVHVEVAVDKAVAHGDNLRPGNPRNFGASLCRDSGTSLAYDLDGPDESQSEHPVLFEVFAFPSDDEA